MFSLLLLVPYIHITLYFFHHLCIHTVHALIFVGLNIHEFRAQLHFHKNIYLQIFTLPFLLQYYVVLVWYLLHV